MASPQPGHGPSSQAAGQNVPASHQQHQQQHPHPQSLQHQPSFSQLPQMYISPQSNGQQPLQRPMSGGPARMNSALGSSRPSIPSGSASFAGHTQQHQPSNNNLGIMGHGQSMGVAAGAGQQAHPNGLVLQQSAGPQGGSGYNQQQLSQMPQQHAHYQPGPMPGQSALVTPGLHSAMPAANGFPRSISAQDGRVGGVAQQLSQMHIANQAAQLAPSPQQANFPEAGPSKGKRAARAYHSEQNVNVHPYDNAPPASGPPGVQYHQQQHQERPDYLQASQPQQRADYVQQQQGQQAMPPQNMAGIPQPPHNSGTRLPGLRNRIDPEQIPSVVAVQEQDQEVYYNEPYLTCGRGTVPLSTTSYTAIDQGSCTPRFMRFSTYNLPTTDDLANLAQMPLAIIVQPFAQPRTEVGEEPVYTVDFSQSGPPRCKRCRGYINPWCNFVEGGQKFICNLCGNSSEVPPEYFSHLDVNGRRLDLDQRPELLRGSVDMLVPPDYWVQDAGSSGATASPRKPQPLHYLFAIDVSCDTARRARQPIAEPSTPEAHPMLREVCKSIKAILYGSSDDDGYQPLAHETGNGSRDAQDDPRGLPHGAKVAIIAYDKVVHFFNLKAELTKPQMLVVGDIDDMFIPLSEGLFADVSGSRHLIEDLLTNIPELFAQNPVSEVATGGVIKAALMAMKRIGGQVNIFQSKLPTSGPGALKPRDETKLQGTDNEKKLFMPQDAFYRERAEEAVEAGIGFNLFLFPDQFIDVATLGVLSGLTGGEVYFQPRFDPVRDGSRMRSQLSRLMTSELGTSVTLRIRCSEGLRISEHYGNFHQRNITDLEFGAIDSDKAISALIKHEGKLDERRDAFFQCAVLYTSASGERRVRLHNIAVPVTNNTANVFRYADMDATMTHCAKEAIAKTVNKSLKDVREQLTELCTKVLLAYRKHCASTTSPGQLILPESFKLFPVYALSFIKTKALRGGVVNSDVRTYYMRFIKSMGAAETMNLLYPTMIPLHTISPEAVQPDEKGIIRLPRKMRTSYARMEPHGSYLLYNGDLALLWLGAGVSPQILRDLYAADSLDELNARMTRLPRLPTRLSEQVRTVLRILEEQHCGRKLPLHITRQNVDGSEIDFANLLIEDANNDNLSYVDYLCFVHKNIQQELSGEKQQSEADAQHMWRSW